MTNEYIGDQNGNFGEQIYTDEAARDRHYFMANEITPSHVPESSPLHVPESNAVDAKNSLIARLALSVQKEAQYRWGRIKRALVIASYVSTGNPYDEVNGKIVLSESYDPPEPNISRVGNRIHNENLKHAADDKSDDVWPYNPEDKKPLANQPSPREAAPKLNGRNFGPVDGEFVLSLGVLGGAVVMSAAVAGAGFGLSYWLTSGDRHPQPAASAPQVAGVGKIACTHFQGLEYNCPPYKVENMNGGTVQILTPDHQSAVTPVGQPVEVDGKAVTVYERLGPDGAVTGMSVVIRSWQP